MAFEKLTSEPKNEVLYISNSLGERIENPRKYAREHCHAEYMAADYQNIWYTVTYPAPMTVAWYSVQIGNHFLHLARKDESFKI